MYIKIFIRVSFWRLDGVILFIKQYYQKLNSLMQNALEQFKLTTRVSVIISAVEPKRVIFCGETG